MRGFRAAIALLLLGGAVAAIALPPRWEVMGAYATPLQGRTHGQRINALRAARTLDGLVIEQGHELSFNRTVGSWTPDRGYVLAPVSYDGELVVDWGGGVCQTSSTLYNAALIAGLEVVERHRHNWAPSYVPPGRDAAVAQYTVDLRLRNPYPWPVRLRAIVTDASLGFEVLGRERGPVAAVTTDGRTAVRPTEVVRLDAALAAGQRRVVTQGKPGARVTVYRIFLLGPRSGSRELVSRDSYPPINRVVRVGR